MDKFFSFLFLIVIFNSATAQENLDVFDVARKGTIEEVKAIFKKNPNSINELNTEGYSPLVLATYRGNNEVAKFLIENGSNINGNSKMGTPLMAAIVKGNTEIAKLLILKNADVNSSDSNGTTALMYAVQFKNSDILKLLLLHNADKTKRDNQGKTAFEFAVFSTNEEINLLK
jgi:ankyrin repeat protein